MADHQQARKDGNIPAESRGAWSATGDPGLGGPMALKSAVARGAAEAARSSAASRASGPGAAGNQFDPVRAPAGEDDPWDAESAEALARIYEAESSQQAVAPAARVPAQTLHVEAARPTVHAPAAPVGLAAATMAPDWLEDRLAEIALKVEQSLAELQPERSVSMLSERFDDFETRMSEVLREVATRTDLDSLKLIEEHIEELARHAEHAGSQFSRLDEIESQLTTVVGRLASLETSPDAQSMAKFDADLQQLIEVAADQAVSRFSSLVDPEAQSRRLDDLRGLVVSFMDDRRRGEEETASALETMQEAMIRVLDKVESLELSRAGAQPFRADAAPAVAAIGISGRGDAPPASPPPAVGASWHDEDYAPEHDIHEPYPAARVEAMPMAPLVAASRTETIRDSGQGEATDPVAHVDAPADAQAMSAAVGHTPTARAIDKVRQDLIAEARRAKLKAEAEAAAAAANAPESKAQRAAKPVDRRAALAVGQKLSGGFRPSRRTMIAALLLLLAIPAVLIAVPRALKKPATPPAATQMLAPAAAERAEEAVEPAEGAAEQDAEPAQGREGRPDQSGQLMRQGDQASTVSELPDTAPGLMFANADKVLSPEQIRKAHERQSLAERSSMLAASAAGASPAALISETPPLAEQAAPVAGQATRTLELPPAALGPLSLRTAAAQGDPSAQFEVGARYAEGRGVDQSFVEAGRWYQRAAAQGFAQAQYRLATLHERGLGFKKDLKRARAWYQRAAEQGNVKAMHNLAVLAAGRADEAPDYPTAARWFEAAADRGLPDSQYNLAVLFENGLGVAKDAKRAYRWYALAALSGDGEAVKKREALRATLTSTEAAEIDRSLSEWRAAEAEPLANDPRAAGEDWKKRQSAGGNG